MYIHPNSVGHNAVDMFPEIFIDNKVNFAQYHQLSPTVGNTSMFKLARVRRNIPF